MIVKRIHSAMVFLSDFLFPLIWVSLKSFEHGQKLEMRSWRQFLIPCFQNKFVFTYFFKYHLKNDYMNIGDD